MFDDSLIDILISNDLLEACKGIFGRHIIQDVRFKIQISFNKRLHLVIQYFKCYTL